MSCKFHQITSVNLILVTMAVLVWKRDPLTDAFVKLVTMETDVNVGELGRPKIITIKKFKLKKTEIKRIIGNFFGRKNVGKKEAGNSTIESR